MDSLLESAKHSNQNSDLNAVLTDIVSIGQHKPTFRNLQEDEDEANFVEDFEELSGTIEYIGEAADQMFFQPTTKEWLQVTNKRIEDRMFLIWTDPRAGEVNYTEIHETASGYAGNADKTLWSIGTHRTLVDGLDFPTYTAFNFI